MADPTPSFHPVIIHYHMFPGGVSTLILNTIELLVKRGAIRNTITFALGSQNKSDWFFNALKARIGPDIRIHIDIIPELFYWQDDMGSLLEVTAKLKREFRRLAGNDRILWAQNPTLGKNAAYTLALKELAQDNPDQRIWMHIHDSAEQGRWPNLDYMKTALPEPYYFDAPGTRWMVINRSDYKAYQKAGMPADHLFYVPDPLLVSLQKTGADKNTVSEALSEYARANGFAFAPDRPWVTFAGRTIRRKNLLEALLITVCAPRKVNFLITLPSDSPDDKPYENMLFNAMREYKAGVAGFGIDLVGVRFGLKDLALSSDLILSASVMEGFGLPYLEFPILGRPVMARQIYIMDDFVDVQNRLPHHYYSELRVPAPQRIRSEQKARYLEKVDLLGNHFQLPQSIVNAQSEFFSNHFSNEWVDFSFLSASAQHHIIENLDDSAIAAIRNNNTAVFKTLEQGLADQHRDPAQTAAAVDRAFGADLYARNINRILASYAKAANPAFNAAQFEKDFLSFYFSPGNLRLLLDYKAFIAMQ